MEYRILGKTGIKVSAIGLGSWPIGELIGGVIGESVKRIPKGWAGAVDEESIRTIRRAEELGVNLLHSSKIYGGGHAESIVGLATRGRRDKWVISTKVRGFYTDEADIPHTRKRIIEACEGSLRRLQSDYIDLYMLHSRPHPETLQAAMETLTQLKREGKIRWSGVSTTAIDGIEGLKKAMNFGEVAGMVVGYNMVHRGSEAMLQFARDNNIGTMIASPLASGVLSGHWFDKLPELDPLDTRYRAFYGDRARTETAFRKFSELHFLATGGKRTVAQAALRFIIDTPGVTAVIPGALRVAELEENAGAASVPPLTAEERAKGAAIAEEGDRIWRGK